MATTAVRRLDAVENEWRRAWWHGLTTGRTEQLDGNLVQQLEQRGVDRRGKKEWRLGTSMESRPGFDGVGALVWRDLGFTGAGDGMEVREMELEFRFWLAGICVGRERSCGIDCEI
ncbi:hypothetical protein M0R45_008937 [Rubus argutus]|uniref:Uncharacterized protein n=1 Tax=Rubus argutus TaxID=59490 RepID=A0AAW1Y2R4_RUBAR